MSRNNVRGPTSALTEFLKESGITPTTIARRRATQAQPTAGPSRLRQTSTQEEDVVVGSEVEDNQEVSRSRRSSKDNKTAGYASDDLDEPEMDTPAQAPKKRKLTKAAEAKLKAQEKAKAKKAAKKNRDDDTDGDEDEDAYTALSKSMWTNTTKPPVGNFEDCAKCEKQFTVTKYTMAANPGPGFLCHSCAKASGNDPFKKSAPPKRRKAPADKRTVVNFEERRFPSLASLCIQIISKYINDVEALGDIGAINMEKISKAISKNRSLTAENAHLFYNINNTTLTLYDATKLTPASFSTLAYLNPSLTSLRIDFCGCIDDSTMAVWCNSLPSLVRLELLGPFLVRVQGWKNFFESHPQLEGFLITQSPRFDLDCVESLVTNCRGLTEVRLKEIGKMDDGFLTHLKTIEGGLKLLDISDPTTSCSEDAVIEFMEAVGSTLTHLDLSNHSLLTDRFLKEGLQPHVLRLTSLTLSNLRELTDEGVGEFFSTWGEGITDPNPPLVNLDLSRNQELSSTALAALLSHSGPQLQNLNINGWKATSETTLNEIRKFAPELRYLNVGWCREVDDFVIKGLMEECRRIQDIKVWGCNRLTEKCPRKRGVSIHGVESHSVLGV